MTTDKERYSGYTSVTDEQLAAYYEGKNLNELLTNQYLIANQGDNLLRYDGKGIQTLKLPDVKGFKPKNDEQKMAFDLMANKNVPVKCLIGIAGSGKTKLGLTFGLNALKNGDVKKLFIVRQPSPVGEEIGFLKGTKDEKLAAWFKPVLDNMDDGGWGLPEMIARGDIEFEAPSFMQGRDLQDTFVLIDEAQLLTVEQVKMLGSRIGEGSTIVFAGDYEQVFNRKYAGDKNGLIKMVELLQGHPLFGVVHMTKSVRGRVAELFATTM
jgi:PhoH-like ATPase